jgi:hypothetical protein
MLSTEPFEYNRGFRPKLGVAFNASSDPDFFSHTGSFPVYPAHQIFKFFISILLKGLSHEMDLAFDGLMA